jgi:uncharacterized protein YgiB involved in biofilm formation
MLKVITASFLFSPLFVLAGCKKQQKCDPADSRAVCEQFQQCMRSETSTEVCRTAEQDANKLDKSGKH